ncbi:MAG TPA: hypothetical protein VGH76_21955 [Actinomycetospora sp.]|jgi:hypothetical protein|uniref:hypothetical protein n=1 Tax=Actinomycetospora sp. TaxID=1872135 RepID=UPI002F41A5BA
MSRPADARRAEPPGASAPGPGPSTPVTGIPAPAPSPETPSSQGAAGGPSSGPGRQRTSSSGTATRPVPPPSAAGGLPSYSWSRRFADWRRGRADGRAGLPGTEPDRPPGTAALEELVQDFLARSHSERLRLDVELAPLLETEAALVTRIEEAGRAADRARERLVGWPLLLDDSQLALRRGGESHTAEDVVRARRAREYDAIRRPLVEDVDRAHRAAATASEELARTRAALRAREIVGATRVRRLHAQTMRRISAYERHLVRRHPAGDRVGPILAAQHPRVPGWVLAAEDPAVPPGATTSTPPTGPPAAGDAAPDPATDPPAGYTGRHVHPVEEA